MNTLAFAPLSLLRVNTVNSEFSEVPFGAVFAELIAQGVRQPVEGGSAWHTLGYYLGITPIGALAVVIASTVMYAAFATVLRLWGTHLQTSGSVFTIAVASLIGSIAARSTLGDNPTMAGGLIALATLLLLERFFGVIMNFAKSMKAHARPTTGAHSEPGSQRPSQHSDDGTAGETPESG